MIRADPRRGSAPAFLVGLALALGSQVGAGLLLYGGPGFLPALSVVLATCAASLALGLVSGAGMPRGRSPVETIRRAWIFLLLAFTGAVFFSAGWEVFRGFGARSLAQGVGLALLVALPLYLGGRLLALLDPRHAGLRAPGPPALAGAATGFLLLGHLFFPTLSPTAVLLLCIVAVSGGALAHGWVLDEIIQVETLGEGEGEGVWKVRRLRRVRPPMDRLVVEAPATVHLDRQGDGSPRLPVDVALEEELLPSLPVPDRVLAMGWRVVPAAVRTVPATAHLLLQHPDPHGVRDLLPRLGGPSEGTAAHLEVLGLEVPRHRLEPADWVLVDAEILEDASEAPWTGLRALLRPGGTLVLVGANEGRDGQGLLRLLHAAAPHFAGAAAYIGPAPDAASIPGRREAIVVLPERPQTAWPERLGRLILVLPEGGGP